MAPLESFLNPFLFSRHSPNRPEVGGEVGVGEVVVGDPAVAVHSPAK